MLFFNSFAIKCQFSNGNRFRFFIYPGSGKKYGYSQPTGETRLDVDVDLPEDIFGTRNLDLGSIETFGVEKMADHLLESRTLDGLEKNIYRGNKILKIKI